MGTFTTIFLSMVASFFPSSTIPAKSVDITSALTGAFTISQISYNASTQPHLVLYTFFGH
jgi:hypothetical protein